jgi:hypothetical protein
MKFEYFKMCERDYLQKVKSMQSIQIYFEKKKHQRCKVKLGIFFASLKQLTIDIK